MTSAVQVVARPRRDPAPARPRPAARPRPTARPRTKADLKVLDGTGRVPRPVLAAVMVVTVIFSAMLFSVAVQAQLVTGQKRIDTARNRTAVAEREIERANEALAVLESSAQLEKQAARLGMGYPATSGSVEERPTTTVDGSPEAPSPGSATATGGVDAR